MKCISIKKSCFSIWWVATKVEASVTFESIKFLKEKARGNPISAHHRKFDLWYFSHYQSSALKRPVYGILRYVLTLLRSTACTRIQRDKCQTCVTRNLITPVFTIFLSRKLLFENFFTSIDTVISHNSSFLALKFK